MSRKGDNQQKRALTQKEIEVLKDYFRTLCDKYKFSARSNMHMFRTEVERQEFPSIEEAEKKVEYVIGVLRTRRLKEKEEKRKRSRPTKPPKPEPKLTKEERGRAISLLRDPSLLYKIHKTLEKDIAGEERNRLLLFVLGMSCKTKYKQMVVLKGESAAGKNWVVDHVIMLYFPARKRGRFTEHAIDYADIDPKEILYIQQLFAPETGGSMRLISTSDGGYIVETTIRDEEGLLTTETSKIPAATMITTTTFIYLDKEFTTRIWVLSLDETEIQTKKVLEFQDKTEGERLQQLFSKLEQNPDKVLLRNTMSVLPEVDEIVIPFGLAEYFPIEFLRVRRDFGKFQDLVKLIAYLHILQRPTYKIHNKKVIFATPQDVYYALALGEETISMTLTGVEKRIQEVAKVVLALSAGETKGVADGEEKILGEVTVNDVMVATGKARTTCYYALKQLHEEGRLTIRKKGRTNLYRPTKKLSLLSFSISDKINYVKLRKTAEKRVEKLLSTGLGLKRVVYNPFTGEEEKLE